MGGRQAEPGVRSSYRIDILSVSLPRRMGGVRYPVISRTSKLPGFTD